jgi:hypothetical protein
MPQQTTITATSSPTLLTDANVTAITFQNTGPHPIYILGTANTTAPSAPPSGWLVYQPGQGERNALLADLFPGVSSPARVWAVSFAGNTSVLVSHA